MWLLVALLACGGAEAPESSEPDPRAPRTIAVDELPDDLLGNANGLAATKLLGALLGQGAATACLADGGTAQLTRVGFTLMEPKGTLELVVHSGKPEVDACLRRVHEQTDYSAAIVPVPFEVETHLGEP